MHINYLSLCGRLVLLQQCGILSVLVLVAFSSNAGFFLSAFSGLITHSEDILLAELTTIYHGICRAIDMVIDDLA